MSAPAGVEEAKSSAVKSRGRPQRRGDTLWPREHGAYAMAAFPALTALWAGTFSLAAASLAAALWLAFFMHEPVLVLVGRRGPRVKTQLGERARGHLWRLGLPMLAFSGLGVWFAPSAARVWMLAGVAVLPVVAWLIREKREKTFMGEVVVAFAFALSAMPIGLSAGLTPLQAGTIAMTWAAVFILGTGAVHGLLQRTKQRRHGPERAVMALSVLLVAGSLGAAALGFWAPLSVAPIAVATFVIGLRRVSPKHLRRIGWTMVATNVFAWVWLMAFV